MSSPNSRKRNDATGGQDPKRQGRAGRGAGGPNGRTEAAAGQDGGGPDSSGRPGPSKSWSTESPFGWSVRDFLVPYILLALSIQRAHGYFIEQYLRSLGLMNVELSTLYRTLRQLERDGLVYSTWEPGPEGPARRTYCLTDAGRWWLDAGAAALAGYRDVIDRFFGSYSGPARRPDGDDDEKGATR